METTINPFLARVVIATAPINCIQFNIYYYRNSPSVIFILQYLKEIFFYDFLRKIKNIIVIR